MRLPSIPTFCCLVVIAVGSFHTAFAQTAPAQGSTDAPKPKYVSQPAKADVILPNATITVDYSAPSAHGRTVFGGLVPYGEVWRTGANAATTLKTTGTLQIGGLTLPTGTYTLYSLPSQDGWKLVVNKQTGQWGTVYDKSQDLGRVAMETGSNSMPVETFVIDFEKTVGQTTELHLKWAGVDASVQITAQK
ncbi:DUF2911 domain-containing protein [Acidicapsa ligni]|uniref:DUF2911 domain-containing protein n=1 Tax=Acidicapsa ligni TaxID=542300 RepID=UPI0021E08A6B|nr:DUF2911 domain-containing protein [Acidicapsa ligni]